MGVLGDELLVLVVSYPLMVICYPEILIRLTNND
jgi:hypothetical protein